jgi:precorrin-3B methylase
MDAFNQIQTIRQLKKALWIINSVELAFQEAQRIEEATFKRVSSAKDYDMIKIFLSGRDRTYVTEFIADTDKLLKSLEKPK